MGSSEKYWVEFRGTMMRTFEMSDLGLMRYFLDLEVIQRSVQYLCLDRSMQLIFFTQKG